MWNLFLEIRSRGSEFLVSASMYDVHLDKIRDIGMYASDAISTGIKTDLS